jgi:ribosomal protein S18 acetylase RimI-like enzyme
MIELRQAYDQLETVKELFREYAEKIQVDLCFQNFEEELASLPGKYALPKGRIVIAYVDGIAAGCVALRPFDNHTCEMKRLYVKESFRNMKLGKALAQHIIAEAKTIGYDTMVLDTLRTMESALGLYKSLGFVETQAYYENPLDEVVYLRLNLNNREFD